MKTSTMRISEEMENKKSLDDILGLPSFSREQLQEIASGLCPVDPPEPKDCNNCTIRSLCQDESSDIDAFAEWGKRELKDIYGEEI